MRFFTVLAVAFLGGILLVPVAEGNGWSQTSWASQEGNVRVLFALDKGEYARGEPVTLRLTVANHGQAPFTYHFRSGRQYDFEIYRGGALIWRWSDGKVFVQMLTAFTVPPGGRKEFAEQWRQTDSKGRGVPPGEYVAVALLPVDREAGGAPAPDRLALSFWIR